MFRELFARESRVPPLMGTGLAAVLMGAVAVVSAHAGLPSRAERADRAVSVVAAAAAEASPHAAEPAFAFASPLAGYAVNSPFGLRKMPWEEGGRLHEGVDIAAPSGTPVRVTLAGTVLRAGTDGGYGRFVEVDHGDGLTSLYAHLGRPAKGLRRGMPLPAGFVVGYVGSSGRSTGAHLHFEIRQDDRPLNPVAFMGRTFATADALPLSTAARVSRRIRIAQVGGWPRGLTTVSRKTDRVALSPPAETPTRVHAVVPPPAADAAAPSESLVRSPSAKPGPVPGDLPLTRRTAPTGSTKVAPATQDVIVSS
ncbi:MAG: M23 family metallopeptidase [Caulobacter sp.]|nr:M23 family metallopeptidase [Caulobacter sp.]